jgi:FecR-like protein
MMRRWTKLALIVALAAALHPVPIKAQTSDAVGIVTTLDGRATVARPAIPSPLVLKFKDDVFGRDKISTQEHSLVRVLLGGKAILTVRELSQVTISEEPGRAVVTLPSGKVVLAVAKQRMRPGESIEIRTPNAIAGVRGSILAVAYDPRQNLTTAICHAGDCTYQYAGGPTNPLPPGQGAKNGQTGPVTADERDAAVNVQTSSKAFDSPDEAFLSSLFQDQAVQAAQVAQFVNTGGTIFPLGGPPAPSPSPTTAPVTAITRTGIESGHVPGAAATSTSIVSTPAGPNVVVNGGFETGNFTGWVLSGNTGFTGVSSAYAHTGNFGAFLGPIGSDGFLSQTLSTAVGTPYIVSFSLLSDGGTPNDFSGSWGRSTFFSQTDIPAGNWRNLSFTTDVATGTSTVLQFGFRNDPGFLGLDDVTVIPDPPLYLVGSGNTLTRAGSEPLLRLSGTPQTFDSLMIVCCGGQVRLGGPLLQSTSSDLTIPFSLVSVIQGGTLVSSTTDPLVQLQGGTHTFGVSIGLPMFEIAGVNAATDPATGLTLGTDRPLQTGAPILETSGAMVNTYQAVRVDNALLEATAPLLALRTGSQFSTAADAVQLSYQAQVTSLGPLVALDGSTLRVANGAALNLAGGSLVRVTGSLFSLANGSTLQVLNGPLVSLSGGSVLSVTGALIAFGGTGGNLVSVSNGLCPCTTIGGIPVSLSGGALANNVSITGAIKNGSLGTVNVAPNAAMLSVNGATTKVMIKGL